jgi:hypothetical protein
LASSPFDMRLCDARLREFRRRNMLCKI